MNPRFMNYMNKQWPISTKLRRFHYYWFIVNELEEFIYSRQEKMDGLHYLQMFSGFEDTNLGLGVVVEAVLREDGTLGETLHDLLESDRYDDQIKTALDEIIEWINSSYLIIRDLSTKNIVWNEKEGHFVIIDGLGARRLPSLRSFSQKYNQRANRKRTAKLRQRVNAHIQKVRGRETH